MKRSTLTFLMSWMLCGHAVAAEDKTLTINIGLKGFPPFQMHSNDKGQVEGFMFDIFKHISNKLGYQVEFAKAPRKRQEHLMRIGKIDAQALAKEWVKSHEGIVFTDPVVDSRDYLYTLKSKGTPPHNPDLLIGKKIIARLGYFYPTLSPYFKDNRITRVNTNSDLSQLRMLKSENGDAAISNELVVLWYQKNYPKLRNSFVKSENPMTTVQLRYAMNAKRAPLLSGFNREIKALKDSGELQKIIEKYQ